MSAKIVERQRVYSGWTNLDRVAVEMPDGATVERHIEDHGVAVAVLPYDPQRRVATLVSMPRAPLLQQGDQDLLEVVAGALGDEAPEECARREALEEAGLRLGSLEPVGFVWSMPALSTERIHLYLGEFEKQDAVGPGGGASDEHENISVHTLSLSDLWSMVEEGRLPDMKTVLLVQALKATRPELFS